MFKRVLSLVLVSLFVNAGGANLGYAGSKEDEDSHLAEGVKERIRP